MAEDVSKIDFGSEKKPRSPTFEKHLAGSSREWLYHYTSQSGLLGILRTEKVWLTKVQYMNDSTEYALGFQLAIERVERIMKSSKNDKEQAQLSKLHKIIETDSQINVFVACFCEDGDLLSQWRAYSGASQGYSLGMSSAVLADKIKGAGFVLGKCIYDRSVQEAIIDELIALCLKHGEHCAGAFLLGMIRVAAFFKNAKFSEEQEWRVVSLPTIITAPGIGFPEGKSMVVPFLRLGIGRQKNSAIKHAYVGPCPHPRLSNSSMKMLFLHFGLTPGYQTDVRDSAIPYRNW